jgi:hypothetical protein
VLRVPDIIEVSAIVAAAGVVVAALSIIVQNRKAEKTRKTELIMQLFGPLRDFEFIRQWVDILQTWEWKDYDDFREKYFGNPDEYAKFIYVTSFYNTVGLLLKTKIIDLETVSRWHPEATIWLWEKIGPVIKEGERRMIESGRWHMEYKPEEWFEYLYNEMKKREQQPASNSSS